MCQKIFDYHNSKQEKESSEKNSFSANGLVADIQVNPNENYNVKNDSSTHKIQK
jgi:hypothetical protein